MKKQDSFRIYYSDVSNMDYLPDASAGELFKAITKYALTNEVPMFSNDIIKAQFMVIKKHLDEDIQKYQKLCNTYSENAKKRYVKKGTDDSATSNGMQEAMQTVEEDTQETSVVRIYESEEVDTSFENLWTLYDVPASHRIPSEKAWNALTEEDRSAAIRYIPRYLEECPDRRQRKFLVHFLRDKQWRTDRADSMS